MIVHKITDNQQAEDWLRHRLPKWCEEMPVAAAHRNGEMATVVHCVAYSHREKSGVIAFFFGHGCDPQDRGWSLLIAEGVDHDQFLKAAEESIAEAKLNLAIP